MAVGEQEEEEASQGREVMGAVRRGEEQTVGVEGEQTWKLIKSLKTFVASFHFGL